MSDLEAKAPSDGGARRKLLRRLGIYLLVGVGSALGLHLYNAWRMGLFSLRAELDDKIELAESLAVKAQEFDQAQTLAALGDNQLCGPVFRFDDRFAEAKALSTAAPAILEGPLPTFDSFEFDGPESGFDPTQGTFEVREGSLRIHHEKDAYLYSDAEIEIAWDDIAEIEIRVKLEKGDEVELALALEADAQRSGLSGRGKTTWEARLGILTYHVIADGEFHVYRADARKAESPSRESGGNILRRIIVQPSNIDGDVVEIDYIRFIDRSQKFRERPYAPFDQVLHGEQRRTLYMRAPMALEYEVAIPASAPELRFGIGTLEESVPVNFEVRLGEGADLQSIFSQSIRGEPGWIDVRIDLKEWAGRTVKIQFACDSQPENIAFWSNPVLSGARKKRMNVVFILEDTLRADHLSAYGYFRTTSPEFDRWAQTGVLFESAVSQGTVTRSSCPSLMTSLYPSATGAWNYDDKLDDRFLTLSEILRSQGFATAAFMQNPNASRPNGLDQGYSVFFDRHQFGPHADSVYGDRLTEWLDRNHDRNFFLYLHLIDPHAPYEPPEGFDLWEKEVRDFRLGPEPTVLKAEEWAEDFHRYSRSRSLYDGEIANNDKYFGRFLNRLDELDLREDTLLVFLSDHGEFLGDHNIFHHQTPSFVQGVNVPLAIAFPSRIAGSQRVATPVQLLDVMPTVLDYTKVESSGLMLQGDSLIPLLEGEQGEGWERRAALVEEVANVKKDDVLGWGSIFLPEWHWISSSKFIEEKARADPLRRRFGYFHARNFHRSSNPQEVVSTNLYSFDPIAKWSLSRKMRGLQQTNLQIWKGMTRGEVEAAEYDAETVEHLKQLGYLK